MYGVITGEKHFTLLPPADHFYLYEREYPAAIFKEVDEWFEVHLQTPEREVPWIPVDPDAVNRERFPLAAHITPIHAVVKAGDVLYLPALWHHKVAQRTDAQGRCIAFNQWYDMQYDVKFCYYRFLERMCKEKREEIEKLREVTTLRSLPVWGLAVEKFNDTGLFLKQEATFLPAEEWKKQFAAASHECSASFCLNGDASLHAVLYALTRVGMRTAAIQNRSPSIAIRSYAQLENGGFLFCELSATVANATLKCQMRCKTGISADICAILSDFVRFSLVSAPGC
jgi:hypothetical protein